MVAFAPCFIPGVLVPGQTNLAEHSLIFSMFELLEIERLFGASWQNSLDLICSLDGKNPNDLCEVFDVAGLVSAGSPHGF